VSAEHQFGRGSTYLAAALEMMELTRFGGHLILA
jgi:hypothetical protein